MAITKEQGQALFNLSGGNKTQPYVYRSSGGSVTSGSKKATKTIRGGTGSSAPTRKQEHINKLTEQLNTGTDQEKKWAVEALGMHGYRVIKGAPISEKEAREIFVSSGGDPAVFRYDPGGNIPTRKSEILTKYETPLPKNVVSEAQAKGLFEYSGGKSKDFTYNAPKMYDTVSMVYDRALQPSEFDNIFGEGAYSETKKTADKLVKTKTGEFVDKKFFRSLSSSRRKGLLRAGTKKWFERNYTKDPVTGREYDLADIGPTWGKRGQNGTFTGEIDWKKLHRDNASAEMWDLVAKKDVKALSDKDVRKIGKKYGYSGGAREGIQEVMKEYSRLSSYEKAILQSKESFASKKGMEGLIAYGDAQVAKRKIADSVISKYADADGKVDVSKMAIDALRGGGNRKAIEAIMEAGGFNDKDIAEVADYAEEYVAQTKPKSYGQQVSANLNLMAEIIVPGYDLARNWDKYSSRDKVVFGLIDALMVLPIVGAAGKAGKAVSVATKGSRSMRAAQNLSRVGVEVVGIPADISRRSLKGVATATRHPITATKELGVAIKSLAKMGIYPIVHPSDTAVGLARVSTGKVDLPPGWLLGEGARILAPYGVVKLQMKSGDEIVWTGLKIGNQPLIGKSGKGGWVVGTPKDLGIDIMDINAGGAGWVAGEKASEVLAAKVLNPKVLENAGLSPEAARMINVYKEAAKATGNVRPGHIEKTIPVSEVAFIKNADGVQYVIDKISREGGGAIYGSFITEKQLHPDIKPYMRESKDIDIHTNWSQEKTERVAAEIADKLRKITGEKSYRVKPENKTLVELYVNGDWRHAVDLHAYPETEKYLGKEISGEWAWGVYKDIQPPIVFKTQSGLEIKGQTIAEQIRRKGATSTTIQEGGILWPSDRRAKDPGDWRMYLASVAREKGVNRSKVERLIEEIEKYYDLPPFKTVEQAIVAGMDATDMLIAIPPSKLTDDVWENIASSAVSASYNSGIAGRSIIIPASGSLRKGSKSPSPTGKTSSPVGSKSPSSSSKTSSPVGSKSPSSSSKTSSPVGGKSPSPTSKTPSPVGSKTPSPTSKTPSPVGSKSPSPTSKTPSPVDGDEYEYDYTDEYDYNYKYEDDGGDGGGGVISFNGEHKRSDDKPRREEPGLVAWQQGEVDTKEGRKPVYVVARYDGTTKGRGKGGARVTLVRPAGMRRAKGTPQQTLTRLKGIPPKELNVDIGAFNAKIRNGTKITFGKDRSGLKYQKKIVRRSNDKLLASSKSRGRKRGRVVR